MAQDTLNNTKFNTDRLKKILDYLKEGRHISHACALSGIHVSTLYNWIEKEENGDNRFEGIGDLVHEAKAIGETLLEDSIIEQCKMGKNPDARTMMHVLTTKNRPVYANVDKLQVDATVKHELNWGDFIQAMEKARDESEDKPK